MRVPYYGSYRFPDGAVVIGWFIASASVLPIPIGAVYSLFKPQGSFVQVTHVRSNKSFPRFFVHRTTFLGVCVNITLLATSLKLDIYVNYKYTS